MFGSIHGSEYGVYITSSVRRADLRRRSLKPASKHCDFRLRGRKGWRLITGTHSYECISSVIVSHVDGQRVGNVVV